MFETFNEQDKIGTYKIHKISLSYFDHKIYIQSNGFEELACGY